jgi:HlyB family type I secretion system ABC transporter
MTIDNEPTANYQAYILKFLRLAGFDINFAQNFVQFWEKIDFKLGSEIASYNPAIANDERQGLFLVCEGGVRLLGFDETLSKEVPIQRLEVDEVFGGDSLFYQYSLPYRGIGASDGCIAYLSLTCLQQLLEEVGELNQYLREVTKERQKLLFFKTSTELRSLTSQHLRQILPNVVEKNIEAGISIAEVASANQGHFWLLDGKINSVKAGNSWGYPNQTLGDAVTETNVITYFLNARDWDSIETVKPIKKHLQEFPIISTTSTTQTFPFPQGFASLASPTPPPLLNLPTPRLWRRYPFIGQQSFSDCGAACLAMISLYWGKRFSLNTLKNLAGVDKMGASIQGLGKAAETIGYHARPVRASLSQIQSQPHPWIAHWQENHYVVVWQIKGNKVLISDPAIGRRSLTWEQFTNSWTQYALLLDPTATLLANKNEKISLGSLSYTFWHNRNVILQIIFASILLQIFGLATPLFIQVVIDRVLPSKSIASLNVLSTGLLIFGIWRLGISAARQYLLDYFANRIDLTLVSGFMSHALRLPLSFFSSRQVGDIVTRVQENQKIQFFLTRKAISLTLDALCASLCIALMLYYSLRLTVVALGIIPPIIILTLGASPFLNKFSREISIESSLANSAIVEMITGIATLKATTAERPLRWRWEERFTSMLHSRFRGQKLANSLQLVRNLINYTGSTIVLWYGAVLVIEGKLSVGEFVAFNLLIGYVVNPISALFGLWDEFQEMLVSLEKVNDVFASPAEENPKQPLLVLPKIRGHIIFENVTFRYNQEAERNTLQNLSFEVLPGQIIAIVGRSGSGKTTLANLIQSLYRPNSGRILIDGHDINLVSPNSLRSQLGVVPQEIFLFSGTILENIILYSDELILEKAIAAAKLADAHSFIQRLPLGYNTPVGEAGKLLSGGQRQKIAIARAIARNPRILILDEATSALDTESERRFSQNLNRFFGERTTFIIAHRRYSVRHAHKILVLDRGILVEQGSHEQLMAISGLYYHLLQEQLYL